MGGFQFVQLMDQEQNTQLPLATDVPKQPSLLFNVPVPMPQQHNNQLNILNTQPQQSIQNSSNPILADHKIVHKSDSFESTFGAECTTGVATKMAGASNNNIITNNPSSITTTTTTSFPQHTSTYPAAPRFGEKTKDHLTRKHKHSKRLQMQQNLQLQFDDPNVMDCGGLNEFLSSSSLSSSDSEAAETNDSDREGDDELTDWPGNEAMVNFTSKNDFKRAKPRTSSGSKPIKTDELGQDDDTLMSADEIFVAPTIDANPIPPPPNILNLPVKYSPSSSMAADINLPPHPTLPIDIHSSMRPLRSQIESEMSGETSNHFLSSPNTHEVREIRAGCRRIRNERPGFTILTSINEDLSK